MASSGHLRRCAVADTSNKCLSREKDSSILSWPTTSADSRLRWPHQATYDVLATPIRRTNA
eukprot:scaffold24491_cov67-Skeletonema_dohrnii-CCMP3373.AAC.1